MTDEKAPATAVAAPKPICGIVMPISMIDGCPEAHWLEVRAILEEAVTAAGFDAKLVSDADDVGIIQARIIQNLYMNPVLVCDVSGKNANVMFELGLRLAFDKPTIIVKDDKTSYSFDTAPIEHLGYPRDLRYPSIVAFKEQLREKVKKTHQAATQDPNYTTFLKNFGEFKIAKIDSKEVSGQEFMLSELHGMVDEQLTLLKRLFASRFWRGVGSLELPLTVPLPVKLPPPSVGGWVSVCQRNVSHVGETTVKLLAMPGIEDVQAEEVAGHLHLRVGLAHGANVDDVIKVVDATAPFVSEICGHGIPRASRPAGGEQT